MFRLSAQGHPCLADPSSRPLALLQSASVQICLPAALTAPHPAVPPSCILSGLCWAAVGRNLQAQGHKAPPCRSAADGSVALRVSGGHRVPPLDHSRKLPLRPSLPVSSQKQIRSLEGGDELWAPPVMLWVVTQLCLAWAA